MRGGQNPKAAPRSRGARLQSESMVNNVEIIVSAEIGRETVQYVSNIYKYYLAYKMVTKHQALSEAIQQKIQAKTS
jgi:hypothetical protein